jgi:hypothetical protein
LFDELRRLFDEDLAGLLAERRAGDVGVSWEAVEIDFGQDVTQGVVGQAEQEVVLAARGR